MWENAGKPGKFIDYILDNSGKIPSTTFADGKKYVYKTTESIINDLSFNSLKTINFEALDVSPKYICLINDSGLSGTALNRLKYLIYQVDIKKIDVNSININEIFTEECKRTSPLLRKICELDTETALVYLEKNVSKTSPLTLRGFAVPISQWGINEFVHEQKINLIVYLKKHPEVAKKLGFGVELAFTAVALVDFVDVLFDAVSGVYYGTMTYEEAGKKIFEWGNITIGATIGAEIGSAIVPPFGTIIGGILGGITGYFISETCYDNIYSDSFNGWDALLAYEKHFQEGSNNNDVFNLAHSVISEWSIRELIVHPDDTKITFDIDVKGGNDYVAGYHNDDSITGGSGCDMLVGCGGNDIIYGDEIGNDVAEDGMYYNDLVYGGSGNDTIWGGLGDDIIYGDGIQSQNQKTDMDVLWMPTKYKDEQLINKWLGYFEVFNPYSDLDETFDDEIHGGSGADLIFGNQGDDTIYGDTDNDQIYGGIGNDTIYGGEGDDFIDGGEDDDTIYGGNGNDTIIGGTGDDTIDGGIGDDKILLDSGTNYVIGGAGNDWIVGGINDDTIFGDDETTGVGKYNGDDTIDGGAGDDYIYGGAGNDSIDGGLGSDHIFVTKGNNKISGGNGVDYIWGGSEFDEIYGNEDTDYIFAGAGDDIIDGGSGDDYLSGQAGSDEIYGGIGSDYIWGGTGNDYLWGEDGEDHIYGEAGDDILDGGVDDDILSGGEGNDYYIFGYGDDNDVIYDFNGISQVDLSYVDLEAIQIELLANKQDVKLSLYDFEYDEIGELNYNIKTGDSLCIKHFDKCGENTYFWIDDESYQIEEVDGELVFVQRDVPGKSSSGGIAGYIKGHIINDLGKRFDDAGKAQPPRDPLVIYFTESATSELIGVNDSDYKVFFDLDRNGFAEQTAWIGPNDGFLVYDRNGNGVIDDGGELFSDQVIMSNGKRSESGGFEALADLDDYNKKAKIIDKNDKIFSNLKVWIDADTDGVTDDGELHTLEELGIKSISYNYTKVEDDENTIDKELGIKVTDKAIVTFTDNSEKPIAEHWFDVKSYNTQETHIADETNSITSFGNMPSIGNAIEADETGELSELVEKFNNSESFAEKHIITKKILYFITGADSIEANSRGGYIDARDLHVIETIMGVESFIGADGGNNPNSVAGSMLKTLYMKFEKLYFTLLNLESNTSDYIELINEIQNDNGMNVINLTNVKVAITENINSGFDMEEKICSVYSYLSVYDSVNNTNYSTEFINDFSEYKEIVNRYDNITYVIGTSESDKLTGSSSNELFWTEEGSDTINAYGGNDIIYSGSGNNTINAGTGNDVVYSEDGDDTINGDADNDTIYAGDGKNTVNGGEGDDRIYTGNGTDTVRGGDGNDIIESGDGDDIIYGEADDDIIDAGEGNDKIYGGAGNDDMNGGDGDDTFYIGIEHGNDIIRDSEGHTTIVFEDELSESDYKHSVDISGGFVLVNKETEERISLADFINSPLDYTFIFNDEETILGGGDRINSVDGTEDDDTITLENGFNIVHGNGGADTITGGSGIDFIYGGDGNDVLNGGEGTNIVFGEGDDDIITDGSGDSYLNGGAGNDTIYGYDGNDVLIGGADVDELYGGEGNDALAGNDGGDYMYGENGSDVLYGDEGNDYLYGGEGNDFLFGGDDDDEIHGDEGDDYLESGNGLDYLYGGTGDDTFVGGEGTKYMYGEDGNDTFYGGNGINYMYGGEGDDVFTGGEDYDYIEGGAGDDVMNGGNGENEMYGNDGNDIICGGNVADYIEGGAGNDTIYGGNGENTIYGNEGNDIIYGGDNGSYLNGGEGNDEIYAGGGADILDGGSGDDYLQGDHGNDTYIFARGYDTDTISASSALHTIVIHDYSVSDMINSRESNNDLVIDFGENTGDRIIIRGFFNFNSNREFKFVFDDGTELGQSDIKAKSAPVVGDEGNNYLDGTDDNDIIDGGAGIDSLNGFGGEDTYIFGKGYAQDMINEWGSDHSFVNLKDIRSDEVTVSDQWGSNLLVSVNDTDDVLTISNFKWGQATYTFRFADGAEGYVDKNTWELVLTKQPDVIEEEPADETEELVQESAEILESLYTEKVSEDLAVSEISELLTSDTVSVSEETEEVFDQTDIQVMILTENMAAFGSEENVFDNTSFAENSDVSVIDQMLVNTSAQ